MKLAGGWVRDKNDIHRFPFSAIFLNVENTTNPYIYGYQVCAQLQKLYLSMWVGDGWASGEFGSVPPVKVVWFVSGCLCVMF